MTAKEFLVAYTKALIKHDPLDRQSLIEEWTPKLEALVEAK